MDNIAKLVIVFNDTMKKIKKSPELSKAVEDSIKGTRLYMEEEHPELPEERKFRTVVEVSKDSTFQAAIRLLERYSGARTAVHNFASAIGAGGGVAYGATAQEECLCRCSTLYPVLKTDDLAKRYYKFHRALHSNIYTDACIWSPDIIIMKDSTRDYEDIEPRRVDVLTCAAPNMSLLSSGGIAAKLTVTKDKLREIHIKRARHILEAAAANGDEIVVLGAFGCGAFANDPAVVSAAYKEVISEFSGYFRHIEFAVYSASSESRNYKAFKECMSDLKI